MASYCLCAEGADLWSIFDEATQTAAKIDGIHLSEMGNDEARHMLKLLRSIEIIRSHSTRTAAAAKRLGKLSFEMRRLG